MGRGGKPIAGDEDKGPSDQGAARHRPSFVARLLASGALERARDVTARRLLDAPGDAGRWTRLAELDRFLGALAVAARAYRRAAVLSASAAEAEDLHRLLSGDPRPSPGRRGRGSGRRAEPFLIRPSPLPKHVVDALLAGRASGSRVARVGAELAHKPSVRDARVRAVPRALRSAVGGACESLAREAAGLLFATPPRLGAWTHSVVDYSAGGGYHAHRDRSPGSPARILSLVVYLSVDETIVSGGDLLLYDRHGEGVTRLRPRTGMAIAFRADALHEVTRLEGPADGAIRRTVLTMWYQDDGALQR